ncbi:MAG: hypothetical protein IJT15_04255 [Rickettsiales bacterium]|nr:hypothetical protein [Rickettsiales bacterium]
MKNPNDSGKLNGVCIYKHGNDKNEDSKTKWIMVCFKNPYIKPKCQITFKTNENDKITNVEIETAKDSDSESTYTISLNESGEVAQITKGDEAENANKNYAEEIKQLLFGGEINKVLTENIEYELDSQQKVVFDKIKEYLGVVEEKEENKENKKEEKKKDKTDIVEKRVNINNQTAGTNIDNIPRCFGSYIDENGKKGYRCFGVDIPCL